MTSKNGLQNIFFILVLLMGTMSIPINTSAQVQLRDTVIEWQHHRFELNPDYSIKTFSTDDTDIQQVSFTNAKVLENSLIKLILLPEYGGRVLSFIYKPTGKEYLYQSECGSAYQIGNNIFYYDWLMVYGGIFPTFPEPEHGKTWLLPWSYSILKSNSDSVVVRMELTDSTAYSKAPSSYNNGITNITCQVDIGVYRNSAIWDFDVKLINNENKNINYEYWTCTTFAPGSEVGNTGTPLNSEMVIPVEQYFAAWSPGGWIGNNGSRYSMENINYLSAWRDMGIAYAHNFKGDYWGVINHDNEQGIFRVSDNIETPGVKLWTWGRNNIDNNMYDFSNGGADNYIELWAGVSEEFFKDATLNSNETQSWLESYCATVNLSGISNMNKFGGVHLIWDAVEKEITYELNTYQADASYTAQLIIQGSEVNEIITRDTVSFNAMGWKDSFSLASYNLLTGNYTIYFDLFDSTNTSVLSAEEDIEIRSSTNVQESFSPEKIELYARAIGENSFVVEQSTTKPIELNIYDMTGKVIYAGQVNTKLSQYTMPSSGMYMIVAKDNYTKRVSKVFVY